MNVGERYNIRTGVTEGQLIHRCVTAMCTSIMVISWVLVLLSYVLEAVFGVWAGVTYFLAQDYVLFGVTTACIIPACLFLSVVSLIWYYDLDKYYIGLKESHPHDQQLQKYSRFLHFGSVLAHLLLFGQLYRYCQLIFHTCSQRSIVDQASLKRDAGLVRFLHGFLSSAPMTAVQLYAVIQTLVSGQDFLKAIYPITLASLLASTLSLLLTLLAYIASDRLHEEGRRVVWVGYIAMFLWHLMMVAARISVLVMFAHTFGFYVSIVVGVHWIATLIWLLLERTNFCGESTSRPPKRRIYFEIPFAFLLSFVFLFIYFNVKDSSSLVRSIVYHLLTAIETAILASLFYAFNSTLSYTPWWFGFTVGLYLIGIAIMSLYYCAWHPNRTDNCYMIGLPKHCCGCCSRRDKGPAIGNVDLPLRDTSSSSGGEDRITPTIRVQEEDTHVLRTGQTPDRLTVTPLSSSAYNRLDPTPGQHDRSGGFLPLSSQLNYSSQSGVLGERYFAQNGETGTQHQSYYQQSSANVQRSHSHNQPRPRRETWFRDDRRNSDLPFGSSTQHPYRPVLGGGAAYVSDFAVTRQHLPQYNGYISRPSSGWSGNESGTATSLQRTPSNQCPSRSSTPFPTVQVNGIRDSVTELNQPAVRPRSYGNPLHTSSAAYSSSPHIRSHEGVIFSNPASRPQSRGSYASRNSAHLHLPDSSKRQDSLWIGMTHSRSGGFIPKHSPLLSHHHGPRHYSQGPINTSSPHSRPHSSIQYCEDSTAGYSTAYDPGRESRATNERSTSRSSSEGAYNQRVSGIFDPDGVCDSRVTGSILANNYSPPINSVSLHSTGGTLV